MAILLRSTVIALTLSSATAASAAPGHLISADPIVETPGGTQTWRIRYVTSGPLVIGQGEGDRIVAPEVTRAYARQACRAAARLRYLSMAGEDHVSATRTSARQTLDWIGARFAGERAPSDCPRI
jgi:hypothetical protein